MRGITHIVIHSSATKRNMDIGASEIHDWHIQRDPPFAMVGYHYIIRRSGEVEVGRPVQAPGAHVAGHNANTIGVCMVGGLGYDGGSENNFTLRQFESMFSLLIKLKEDFPRAVICGHRDMSRTNTECPSFDVKAYITGILS